ncbi:DUF4293 family protein [Blattabacterium cuenoti]|uniref:DUF4293 family protein n=1 Tax=Blattabacterium cuenoti TaxID=1653831 RepID=UPI00163C2EF8|nr:DUF4293 family protein [Blattabacterium cuenoti]
MIYRIQTLYLLLSVFIYSIIIYFYLYPVYSIKEIKKYFFLEKIILILCIVLCFFSFILFKKRKWQIYINKIHIILCNTNFILNIFIFYHIIEYKFIILLCSCNIIITYFLYISNKAIKKDIELINSIYRIR